jgi:molybdopterin molybdotransferase
VSGHQLGEHGPGPGAGDDLKSVDTHLADLLAGVGPIAPLDLQLLDAHGCILSESVVADVDLPRFDNSAVDGYAVRLADVEKASPSTPAQLPVVGDIAAGSRPTYTVQPGMSVRIMTGAPVPPGA